MSVCTLKWEQKRKYFNQIDFNLKQVKIFLLHRQMGFYFFKNDFEVCEVCMNSKWVNIWYLFHNLTQHKRKKTVPLKLPSKVTSSPFLLSLTHLLLWVKTFNTSPSRWSSYTVGEEGSLSWKDTIKLHHHIQGDPFSSSFLLLCDQNRIKKAQEKMEDPFLHFNLNKNSQRQVSPLLCV